MGKGGLNQDMSAKKTEAWGADGGHREGELRSGEGFQVSNMDQGFAGLRG